MIGRERELARLRQALDELQAGAPAVVAVAGEPGHRQVATAARAARGRDRRAGCSCSPAAPPSSSASCPTARSWTRSTSTCARSTGRGCAGWTPSSWRGIFPALEPRRRHADAGRRALPRAPRGDRAARPARRHAAARAHARRHARRRPGLARAAASALLRRPPGARVLVAIAMRSARIPALLAEALGGAQRDGTVVRIDLGPLDPGDALALIGTGRPARPARGGAARERREPVLRRAARARGRRAAPSCRGR